MIQGTEPWYSKHGLGLLGNLQILVNTIHEDLSVGIRDCKLDICKLFLLLEIKVILTEHSLNISNIILILCLHSSVIKLHSILLFEHFLLLFKIFFIHDGKVFLCHSIYPGQFFDLHF